MTLSHKHLLVALAYALLTLAFTWPVCLRLTTDLAGTGDNDAIAWNFWWTSYALFTLKVSPFVSHYQFYPHDVSIVSQSLCTLGALMLAPLSLLGGYGLAFNLYTLLTLWLCAVAAYGLAFQVSRHLPGSVLAGFVYAFAPAHLHQMHVHLHVASIEILPVALGAMLAAGRRGSGRSIVLAALAAALAVAVHLEQFVFLLMIGLYMCLASRRLSTCTRLASVAALTAVLLLPILYSCWDDYVGHPVSLPGWGLAEFSGNDLASFVLPNPDQPLVSTPLAALRQTWASDKVSFPDEGVASLGWGLLGLLILGWRCQPARYWLAGGLFVAIFSLGVRLQILGWTGPPWLTVDNLTFGIPLPAAGFHFLPGLRLFRGVGRLAMLSMLFFAVAAALIVRDWPAKHRRWLAPLSLLLLLEYYGGPWPTVPRPLTPGLHEAMQGPGAVLSIPLGWNTGLHELGSPKPELLLYQPEFAQPMLAGCLTRVHPDVMRYYTQSPFLWNLLQAQQTDNSDQANNVIVSMGTLVFPAEATQKDALALTQALQIGYLVCYQPERWPHSLAFARAFLPLRSLGKWGDLEVFSMKKAPLR